MKKFFTFYLNHFRSSEIKKTHKVDIIKSNSDKLYEAPEKCVNNVLSFARAYCTIETECSGTVEMIQN
jgi:hypothetical protein